MSPSDKIKAETNSNSGESQIQVCLKPCTMDTTSELSSASTSDVTLPGTIASIPMITASLSTLKCSNNDQMKTFDPGEESGIERLTSNHCGNSVLYGRNNCSSLNKNSNKNYKAGSKINKLADMLAKRSQNVVEVTQNNESNIISDITIASKIDETVTLTNVSNVINFEQNLNNPLVSFNKTVNNKELDSPRKSRRKSVPNQSCNLNQLHIQSTSKSCLDFSKLFLMKEDDKPECNALGEPLIKLQTDESTKRKAIRKNFKNVELTLILPEKKRRFSARNENTINSKINEKTLEITEAEVSCEEKKKNNCNTNVTATSSVQSPVNSFSSTNLKKESKVKQRKSKRLVETSTQTADIEFITVIKPKVDTQLKSTEENKESVSTDECLSCMEVFDIEQDCRSNQEKSQLLKNTKMFIKRQSCSKKLPSTDELKPNYVKKHSNKQAYCVKCIETFISKEKMHENNKEICIHKRTDDASRGMVEDASMSSIAREKNKDEVEEKQSDKKISKQNISKSDLNIDVSFDTNKKSSVSPRTVQKCSPKEMKTEEQLLEMEMLFYSHLSGNIQENLANHLDGKMDQNGCPIRTDKVMQPSECTPGKTKGGNLLSVVPPNAGVPDVQTSRAPSPYKTRSKTPNSLPPTAKKFKKLPNWQQKFWEKYNFPTNYRYEHRFWDKNYADTEKSAFYLKDLSCLDIKTQLTMRENIKKLDDLKLIEQDVKPVDNLKFPDYLSLMPRSRTGNSQVSQENKCDFQTSFSVSKGKKSSLKDREDSKKSFKSPETELPVTKSRRELSLDNLSLTKRLAEKTGFDGAKVMTRSQNSVDLMKDDAEEISSKRKGSLDLSGSQKMILRRQTSLDNLQKNSETALQKTDQLIDISLENTDSESGPSSPSGIAEISGEWVKPRSYLCGTCCAKFTNLWELEDHKWVCHPNVWCTHYEFEDEKIEKLFHLKETDMKDSSLSELSNVKLTDLYKRYLLPHGSLKTAKLVPNTNFPEQCTKCKKNCMNSSEMHKHMLDCGGDTTWFLTMYSSPMTIKRKWRPFGSRRRKQLGRRDLKRNIPSTPNLRSYHYQHRIRTKPGDVETIQKMLANLPEKRARRAVNFDDIKTRNQATIHSNRLLRKRFKSTFTNNFLKLKNLKKRRQIKQGKKEGSSKSTTDTSSESTPVGSPKRRSNTKETNQMSKQENPDDIFTESSNDCSSGSRRKGQTKKNDVVTHLQRKSEGKKGNKRKPQENKIAKTEKPATRRKSSVSTSPGDKHKKKTSALNAEASAEVIGAKEVIENLDLRSGGCKENKETNKSGKRIKKNTDDCGSEISLKDLNVIEFSKLTAEVKAAKEKIGKKVNRKLKGKKEKSENSDEWQNIQSNTILRLRHSTREKTELVKRLKKKFQNSKRILEMKETKKSQSGNRRSLRLKTLQGSDDRMEILNEQSAFSGEKGEEKNLCQKTIKMTRPVENIENCLIVKQKKAYAAKSLKTTHEKKTVKEIKETSSADPIRRSSRSLLVRKSFNSESPLLEKKIEVNFIDTCQSFADYSKNISLLGKDTKNIYDGMETTTPFVAEDSSNKKSPQIQTEKNAKPIEENLNSLFIQGQVSVLNKNRLHSPRFSRENEKLETTDLGTLDTTRNRDLEEMPILAKVEPILGKFYRKNEQDIPILMPVVEESRDHQSSQAEETCKSISFQIIKKRKKASKEVAPLKIVKKVDNTVQKKESGVTFRLEGSNRSRSSRRVLSETKKVKKKISVAFEKEAASSVAKCSKNPSVSKYFLGICPCEIDKGREETNEESGSDSEPLITLINQSQKAKSINSSATKSNENEKEIENTNEKKDEIKNRSSDEAQMAKSDDYKVEKVTEPVSELPSEFLPTTKVHEREDKLLVLSESEQNNKIKFKSDIKVDTNLKAKIRKSKKSTKTNNEVNVTINEPSELKLEILSLPLKYNDKIPKEPSPPLLFHSPLQSEVKEGFQTETNKETILPERRSRRISKETKSTGEFIIDDPLILVDELWSELDSDSDSSKKKSRKTKKKTIKKKCLDEKKTCDVNLEELLRNFGEKKDCLNSDKNKSSVTALPLKITKFHGTTFQSVNVRKILENRVVQKSYKRLSLKLFRFNKAIKNFGRKGERLSDVKKALQGKQDLIESKKNNLPDLPFLAAEIKQNPVQVIKCHSQKPKSAKKGLKTSESKSGNANAIRLKISLPLESINNMAVFNNNHLTELEVEKKTIQIAEEQETPKNNEEKELYSLLSERDCSIPQEDQVENGDLKNKMKRYEVIDKIFYCEICKTYYYSSSQLKIHKLSNRHKLKETEFLSNQRKLDASETADEETNAESAQIECKDPNLPSASESVGEAKSIEPEKLNDDTLEMPILEGPFIENPLTRLGIDTVEPQSPSPNSFGFSQDSLKDIQRAIGCTDEEMLILTLLGENTIEIENDILDLNSCRPVQGKSATISSEKGEGNIEKANGILKVDLKQRMTSALACLVNKAVFNLLQKYESVAKSSVNPEAVSLLGKLSNLSRRKNILQLNELLKKQKEGEPPVGNLYKDVDKKEPSISYKYQCTICGSRFEKASTRECHISRSHKGKAKKFSDEIQVLQTTAEEEWNDFWSYDASEIPMGNTSQFWCSDCGINFVSPQEVLEHQKLEHQAGNKAERIRECCPLQSSTIGSSDEIFEGKKSKRRPKVFSSEELDQQRILANNELRKLDRKFSNKSKTNKIKWGMDALRFTVEKENKVMVVDEEKEVIENEADKSQAEIKNIDLVPKLNFSRAGNIPEFKVIQKNSFKNRFQKIIDNKLKRKSSRHIQQENETDEMETEVMLVPVVVKKKNKKQKLNKLKKNEGEKNIDVYDFNESESEGEPVVLSHIKKPMPIPTKLKLVKVKEAPSKNKADSTTKDLISDDYDSEDSLPLSIVKKSKPEEEDDDKDEKTSEDGVEKSEGILEQVEYLIEQLENETGSSEKKETTKEVEKEIDNYPKNSTNAVDKNKEKEEDSDDPPQKSLRVSLANKLLELQNLSLKNNSKILKNNEETSNGVEQNESKVEPRETILEEPESSQSTFDEEDSMPLVLMSKRIEETQSNDDQKKCEENTTDVSTTASEDVHLFEKIRNKSEELINCSPPSDSQPMMEENSLLLFPQRGDDCNKANKPFETLNGNVIYCRNESMSDFESDLSNDGLIDSNYEKIDLRESDKNFINKVTEKEDVIIVCSKSDEQSSEPTRVHRKKLKKKDNFKTIRKKKKRFPLLSATIEDNSFRKSEDLRVNKEVIVRKIWNRRKVIEDSTDYEEDSSIGFGINSNAIDMNNDESQTEVEKEIIVNKIWSRKKLDYESEFFEKPEEKLEDVKINKTEVSDEVVIKCGPKPITSPKRRKSKSLTNESSKETIMRKIWSGKCMFQTKAALKTYDSDVMPNCKENEIAPEEAKPRKRGRPAGFSNTKRVKLEEIDKDDQDDLDSLLEEIEREQLEKAIRLEFLQLRRSEKANVEIAKERTNPTIGLFTETSIKSKKDSSEKKKRKKMKRNLRHPRQSLLKRKKFIKKPLRRILPSEGKYFNEKSSQTNPELGGETRDNFLDKNGETFTPDSKVKSRKHKKHRHKHHHHKHKHKKSKHHKSLMSKHKSKYKSGEGGEEEEEDDDDDDDERRENADSFTILEKICQEIPNQIENELHRSMESNSSKMNEFLSPFSFEDSTKDCDEIGFEGYTTEKESSQNRDGNVYEFVEDASDYRTDDYKSRNSNYSND